MKRFLLFALLLCLGLSACTQWVSSKEPVTLEERKAVAELELKLIGQVPRTLSGHDQDWDDVIAQAHQTACYTVCPLRLYEYDGWGELTGRVRRITN